MVLVAPPILLRELEQQKVHNPSRRLRDRAGNYIKWLVEFVRSPEREVRKGVTWKFIPAEPQIDFTAHNLSTSVADDHLIASVIAYRAQIPGPIFVATSDIGLEVKLRHRHIEPLVLEEALRLPDEPDPQERELQNLRRQMAQRRVPALSLACDGGSSRHPIRRLELLTDPTAPSLAEMQISHPVLLDEKSTPPTGDDFWSKAARAAAHFQGMWLSPERIRQYNDEREEFFRQYEKFLKKLLAWEAMDALTTEVKASIANEGTAPATDIDVIFRFPSDIVLMGADDLPTCPKPPVAPRRPDLKDFLRAHDLNPDLLAGLGFPPAFPEHTNQLDQVELVNLMNQEAQFRIARIKHGFKHQLSPMFLRFPSLEAVRSFSATYTISASEMPESSVGELHFVVP